MIRVAVCGLGKMGVSHLSIINAHPKVQVTAVCDATGYVLDVLKKYTGIAGYADYAQMLKSAAIDAVVIATPSRLHAPMVEQALLKGLHVFCEKPFCLEPEDAARLAVLADERSLVNQVGYHNRFVGAFREMKRLVDVGAIGRITHALAEAYGPVVLKPKGSTWRTQSSEGGGCLYDYAAHPINLLNWCFGAPRAAGGSRLGKTFSRDTDDEVYGSLFFDNDVTAQVSVNWSDESTRKMTTKISLWGTNGRIYADRQEIQVYLRGTSPPPPNYVEGWNVKYTTELTDEVWFYLRGEEYSAQIDHFVEAIASNASRTESSFASAAETDNTLAMIKDDAARGALPAIAAARPAPQRRFNIFGVRSAKVKS